MTEQKLCTACGAVGPTRRNIKGSILTEIILWFFFLIPGLIYTIWRHSTVAQVCRNCGNSSVIPVNSPVAQKFMANHGTSSSVQPQVKEQSTSGQKILVGLAVAFVLLIIVVASVNLGTSANSAKTNTPSASISAPTLPQKTLPDADKAYVRASIAYLGSANTDGTKLATTWAGASDGTSSLDDCREATRKAYAEEKARYNTYLTNRGSVPPAFADVDRHITEIHKKSLAGFSTVLDYWESGNLGSIVRGQQQYKEAILEMNSTIAEGQAVMKSEGR
jgi:hypothetical protein